MEFIKRAISAKLTDIVWKFPVVFLTGPRQSGKSTLLKHLFLGKFEFVSLEDKDIRDFALNDPRGFLNSFKGSVIIDEAQRAPDLFSYIQTKVDEMNIPGIYILSGSQNFSMMKNISQSLAGRVGILSLLPFSLGELASANMLPKTADEWMFTGSYPRLVSSKIDPQDFYPSYITTYVERDIRAELKIHDLDKFKRFLSIVAAYTGNPVNLTKLGSDTGIDARTVNSWLSILEESYILFHLPPYYSNIGKRHVKAPKLYFYDTGLLCSLLGFTHADEITKHQMRGHIFEAAVVSEIAKKYFNAGHKPRLYFWRDSDSMEKEIDLLEETVNGLELTEIKSSQTANRDYSKNLMKFNAPQPQTIKSRQVIYDGKNMQISFEEQINVNYKNWKSLA
ncbi:MAG: ATP-binding protein [Treponema sp.]|nr:ATP-binding protein [Treponema sp.]